MYWKYVLLKKWIYKYPDRAVNKYSQELFLKRSRLSAFLFSLSSFSLELVWLAYAGLEYVSIERVELLSILSIGSYISSVLGCSFRVCGFPVSGQLLDSSVGSFNLLAMRMFKISFLWIFRVQIVKEYFISILKVIWRSISKIASLLASRKLPVLM